MSLIPRVISDKMCYNDVLLSTLENTDYLRHVGVGNIIPTSNDVHCSYIQEISECPACQQAQRVQGNIFASNGIV